jgi:hypothetical protein
MEQLVEALRKENEELKEVTVEFVKTINKLEAQLQAATIPALVTAPSPRKSRTKALTS